MNLRLFTTNQRICELWELFYVFRHETLSDFNNIQKSCISTKFTLLWLFNSLQQKFFICKIHHLSTTCLSSSHLTRTKNSHGPTFYRGKIQILHTFLRLPRKNRTDFHQQLCENNFSRFSTTQYVASWCLFHALHMYCAKRGTCKSIDPLLSKQEEHCLPFAQILTSKY